MNLAKEEAKKDAADAPPASGAEKAKAKVEEVKGKTDAAEKAKGDALAIKDKVMAAAEKPKGGDDGAPKGKAAPAMKPEMERGY